MQDMSISFVMPMYNEEYNIKQTVDKIRTLAEEVAFDYEIVIVDDGSTDGSVQEAKKIQDDDPRVKLFTLDKNTKFGGAFAEAFYRAEKDIILYMDSDMPVGLEDMKASIPLIKDNDIVTGYSKIKKGETLLRKFISGVYNLMVQVLFKLNVRDINSGYKIVKRDLVKDIRFISLSPFIDVELFLHAKKKNGIVEQFPLIFNQRIAGKSYIARMPVILATFRDMLKVWIKYTWG